MKALRTLLASMMLFVCTLAIDAQPMSYNAMRNNARFLTDRMAYTLGISDPYIIDDIYRINYDYICGVNDYLDDVALGYRYDDYMSICDYRDYALRELLGDLLWGRLIGYDYFYRPIIFENYRWRFSIYAFDNHRDIYYCHVPNYFYEYRGGHFFNGMRPGAPRGPRPADYHGGFRDGRRGMTVNNHMSGFREPGRGGVMTPNRTGDMRGNMNADRGGNMNNGNRPEGNMNRGDMNNGRPTGGTYNRGGNTNTERPTGTYNRGGNINTERPTGTYNRGGNTNTERTTTTPRTERTTTTTRTERTTTTPRMERPSSTMNRSSSSSTPSRSGNMGGATRSGNMGGNSGGASRGGGNAGGGSRGGRR